MKENDKVFVAFGRKKKLLKAIGFEWMVASYQLNQLTLLLA